MSLLSDFAEWFKARKTRIEKWYSDGQGRYAFRTTVDGQAFVCVARSTAPKGGKTSIMKRVAGKAQTSDALIAIRLPDGIYVFDPVTALAHGEPDEPRDEDRKDRGEEWVSIDVGFACKFRDWYDGHDEPAVFGEVGSV